MLHFRVKSTEAPLSGRPDNKTSKNWFSLIVPASLSLLRKFHYQVTMANLVSLFGDFDNNTDRIIRPVWSQCLGPVL